MKRRSREISIFNLSMLDVIFGAMGAFMLLFLMVVTEVRPPARPCPQCQRCEVCRTCPQCRPCKPCKRNAFFVVWIVWKQRPRADVDLYAIAPNGKYCGFVKKREPGPPEMDLLWDYRRGGPGRKETILVPQAIPGRWRIAYHHFKGAPTQVKGFLRGSAGMSKTISTRYITHATHNQSQGWRGRVVLEFTVTPQGGFTDFRERR